MRRLATIVVASLLAAGCGSGRHDVAVKAPPRVPRPLAERLARQSDAIAVALAAGDACRAQELGAALRADATASIARIPPRFREPLSSGVNAVVAQLPPCVHVSVPAQTNEAERDDDRGKGRGKGHEKKPGKGRGKGRD